MNVFLITTLICFVGLAWFWRSRFWGKTPLLKRNTARTWPASRAKFGAKRKFVVPF